MPPRQQRWDVHTYLTHALEEVAMANDVRLHFFSLQAVELREELIATGGHFNQILILVQLVQQLEQQLERI